jgi:hypothetical protein
MMRPTGLASGAENRPHTERTTCNGPTGEIQLWFKKRQTRFVSYAADRYAEAG